MLYTFENTQKIPASMEEVWDFISSPKNLKQITPPYMGFDITSSNLPDKMYPGMIICYKVSPLLGLKLDWVTEITHVVDGQYFVDEQRIGPYALWHHQHHIKPIEGGVLMHDIVNYQPPFGIIGDLMNAFVIRARLDEIFDYRREALEHRFGKYTSVITSA